MTPRLAPVPPDRSADQVRFEGFLRTHQLKLTGERRALLSAVLGWGSHFDADTLHMALKQKGETISRATVYRTLDLLVQCGIVRKDSLGHQQAQYEAVKPGEHHDHLICMNCGKVIEFFREDLESLQDAICAQQKFKPLHHSLQIFGICSACKGKVDEKDLAARVSQIHT
ncbi:MAG: transcriptional repressor [Acidobacteria bacterium]|nr:transcriptional repressor [Acidobacteriota bacterium]